MEKFFVPAKFDHVIDAAAQEDDWKGEPLVEYELNFIQRVFVTMEYPYSCTLSTIVLYGIGLNIIINIVVYIIGSIPKYNVQPTYCNNPVCNNERFCLNTMICKPEPNDVIRTIDAAGILIFTVDYCLRLFTCWAVPPRLAGLTDDANKKMSPPEKFFRYLFKFDSIVDFVSIAPFYIALIETHSFGGLKSGFIRILRVPRLLQYIFVTRGTSTISALITILFRSLARSANVLLFILYFYLIGTILFATTIFVLEGGDYVVNTTYPTGAYLRDNASRTGLEQTLFVSIAIAIYYTVVTTTTLGYGDFTCQTPAGRAVACLLSCLGVIVLALPIAVIGSNFFDFYVDYLKKVDDMERQREEDTTRLRLSFDAVNTDRMGLSLRHEVHCAKMCPTTDRLVEITAAQSLSLTRTLSLLTVVAERMEKKKEYADEEGKMSGNDDDCFGVSLTSDPDGAGDRGYASPSKVRIMFAPFKASPWEIPPPRKVETHAKKDVGWVDGDVVSSDIYGDQIIQGLSEKGKGRDKDKHKKINKEKESDKVAAEPVTQTREEISKALNAGMHPHWQPLYAAGTPLFVPSNFVYTSGPEDIAFPTVSPVRMS